MNHSGSSQKRAAPAPQHRFQCCLMSIAYRMGLILVPVTKEPAAVSPPSSLLRDLEVARRRLVVRGGDFLCAKDTVSSLQQEEDNFTRFLSHYECRQVRQAEERESAREKFRLLNVKGVNQKIFEN